MDAAPVLAAAVGGQGSHRVGTPQDHRGAGSAGIDGAGHLFGVAAEMGHHADDMAAVYAAFSPPAR